MRLLVLSAILAAALTVDSCRAEGNDSGTYDCQHGGTCLLWGPPGEMVFTCKCPRGAFGRACEYCVQNFLPIDGMCVNSACVPDGVNVCSGSGECVYTSSLDSWSCSCSEGYRDVAGICVPSKCVTTKNGISTVCSQRGFCQRIPGGQTANDYACSCGMLYKGDKCEDCNTENAREMETEGRTECVALPCFETRRDLEPCGGHGVCRGYPSHDNEAEMEYSCECYEGYTAVNGFCKPSTCVFEFMGEAKVCGYDDDMQDACRQNSSGEWVCACPEGSKFRQGYGCVSDQCIAAGDTVPCGNAGHCYLYSNIGDSPVYKCACMNYAAGDYCKECTSFSVKIDGVCTPRNCAHGNMLCNGHGKCVRGGVGYVCECDPDYDLIIDGIPYCGIEECYDAAVELVCSGAGVCNEETRICVCNNGFRYTGTGACIPESLIENDKICNDRGTAVLTDETAPSEPGSWGCECSKLYSGTKCGECNPKTSFSTGGPSKALPVCTSRDCYTDGYARKDDGSYIDTPTKLCTDGIAANVSVAETKGECREYMFSDDLDFFSCRAKTSNYTNAYNTSLVFPTACTVPSQAYRGRTFMCGLHVNYTHSIERARNLCVADGSDGYTCQCDTLFTLVTRTIGGEPHYACMHDNCRNSDADPRSTDINDYCSGLGDCVLSSVTHNYGCVCGANSVRVNGTCVSKTCITEQPEDGTGPAVVCSGRGKCVHWGDGEWGCQCDDLENYLYINNGCYPISCVYTMSVLNTDAHYSQLCGNSNGHIGSSSNFIGGKCIVNVEDPEQSYCECYEGFVKYERTCVHRDCVAVDLDSGFQATASSICSGTGYCLARQLGHTAQCVCTEGNPIGPLCSYGECVTVIDYEVGEDLTTIYLNCGRPGAGVCTTGGASSGASCTCNLGYKPLAESGDLSKLCVHQDCFFGGREYCGGDSAATCQVTNSGATCHCSAGFVTLNNSCVPAACYAPDSSGTMQVCGGVEGASCVKNGGTSQYKCQCSKAGYGAAKLQYNGVTVWTCAPNACIDGTGDSATLCGGDGGTCVGSGDAFRCNCQEGFVSVALTKCVSAQCISQDANGQDAVCSGVGTCQGNYSTLPPTYSCVDCQSGFEAVNGKCISITCLFQVPSLAKGYLVCGKLGNFGECVGSSNAFKCQCNHNSFLVTNPADNKEYCVPNDCTDDRRHPVECGSHGTCKYASIAEYTCECKAGYRTIDSAEQGFHYCVSSKCLSSGPTAEIICNDHGRCRHDTCRCDEGYGDSDPSDTDATGHCTVCATGYKEYTHRGTKVCVRNNCGTRDAADDCGGPTVAEDNPCQYNTSTKSYECRCKSGFYSDSGICKQSSCTDGSSSVECGGPHFGTCENNVCRCLANMVLVKPYLCVARRCISNAETNEVCYGIGECKYNLLYNLLTRNVGCDCGDRYTTASDGLCYLKTCFNDPDHAFPLVCDGPSNTCDSNGSCTCTPPFYKVSGNNGCVHMSCIFNNEVCGGFGVCRSNVAHTKYACHCNAGFILASDGTCKSEQCSIDGTTICNGAGECVKDPAGTFKCVCNGPDLIEMNNTCYHRNCFQHNNPRFGICSGGGRCDSQTGTCICNEDYTLVGELLCQPSGCVDSSNPVAVCSHRGVCSNLGRCKCGTGAFGRYCETCASGYRPGPADADEVPLCFADGCGGSNCGAMGKCIADESSRSYVCNCSAGHYYEPSITACKRCLLSNCKTCKTAAVCAVCVNGYYPDQEGVCTPCDDDCLTCSGPSDSQCLTCPPGKVHAVGTGASSCKDDCEANKDGCSVCGTVINDSRYCSVCKTLTQFPLEGECTSGARAAACLNVSGGQCKKCAAPYFLLNGGCYSTTRLPGVQICSTAQSGECIECAAGYYMNANDMCISCASDYPGCSECTNRKCTACRSGLYPNFNGSGCDTCAYPCKECSVVASSCTSCTDGYFPQFLASSSNSGQCRRCDDTEAIAGIKGVRGCAVCTVHNIGSLASPEPVVCDMLGRPGGNAGVIAGSIIGVLVVAGVISFCVWWFAFRGKSRHHRPMSFSKGRGVRTISDPDSTSLLSMDATASLL